MALGNYLEYLHENHRPGDVFLINRKGKKFSPQELVAVLTDEELEEDVFLEWDGNDSRIERYTSPTETELWFTVKRNNHDDEDEQPISKPKSGCLFVLLAVLVSGAVLIL